MEYSGLSSILAVFQIIICIVALWAFITWNNGRSHAKKAMFAEEVLQVMYRARQALAWARFPAIGDGEGETRMADGEESMEDKEYRDLLYVPIERLHNESALFSDLYVMRYRFASFFGPNSAGAFQEIENIRQEVIAAAKNLLKDHEMPLYEDEEKGLEFKSGTNEFVDKPIIHSDNVDFAMVDRGVNAAHKSEYSSMKRQWKATIFGPDKRKRKGHHYEGPERRKGGGKNPTPTDAEGWFDRTSPDEDLIKRRIDEAVEVVENICAPYIRQRLPRIV